MPMELNASMMDLETCVYKRILPVSIVVFDAFNTIVKRDRAFISEPYKLVRERATKKIINPMGCNMALREYADAIGAYYTDKEWIKIEGDLAVELSHITPYDDAKSVIQEVRSLGIKTAIGSNLAPEYGPVIKEIFGGLIDDYYFSYEMEIQKPQPDFYRHIEMNMWAKYKMEHMYSSEILMVGDNFNNDYLYPTKMGWQALHLDRDKQYDNHKDRINRLRHIVNRIFT
jgi:FMN phosphatase YigB (HAD superfamily)